MVLTSYYRTRIREEYSTTNCPEGKVCQKAHLLVVYAQSPDFHKLGLCYYLKILYL